MRDDKSIAGLLERTEALKADAPETQSHQMLADLRDALANGLPDADNSTELRAYMSLAARFGFAADVWNAAQLLARLKDLDGHAVLLRAEAWLQLFPETARLRPELLLALLGSQATTRPSDGGLSSLLANWLDSTSQQNDPVLLADTTAAVDFVIQSWWESGDWARRASALAFTYVEVAETLAASVEDLPASLQSKLSKVWARALLLRQHEELQAEGDTTEQVATEASTADQPAVLPSTPADLERTARELHETKRRVWVVGALAAKWPQLMGVAKSLGCSPDIFEHVDYHAVKQQPMIQRVSIARDAGILLGPVPHSAGDVGKYSSLATQLRHEAGVPVFEMRVQSQSRELRITKNSFRAALTRLLSDLATEAEPSSIAA